MANPNPLFPNQPDDSDANKAPQKSDHADGGEAAVELIRAKLAKAYLSEPDAEAEIAEARQEVKDDKPLSKHQQFMLGLKSSGRPIEEIEADWHKYYSGLSDNEKRDVWREFYEQGATRQKSPLPSYHPTYQKTVVGLAANPIMTSDPAEAKPIVSEHMPAAVTTVKHRQSRRSAKKIRSSVRTKVTSAARAEAKFEKRNLRAKQNLKSLAFGLSTGTVVILIFMFSFFNQNFIAPFIHPGSASATPIILDPNAVAPTKEPQVIIPKINLQIPAIYSVKTTDEAQIETALEDGIVHYPTTVDPGQQGNTAYFGHSSNNIFNPGKYKFAFTLLHTLNKGDIFYLTYDQKVYVYKVYDKQIVDPSDVAVLDDDPDKVATATLITCDPPGTSINRLVVKGEQISPSPKDNSHASASQLDVAPPKQIVGNGPSLWSRIWPF